MKSTIKLFKYITVLKLCVYIYIALTWSSTGYFVSVLNFDQNTPIWLILFCMCMIGQEHFH